MIPIVRDAARQTIRFRAGNSRREDIRRSVDEILTAVRERGDSAVREYSQRFDGACPEDFELDRKCLEEAAQAVGSVFSNAEFLQQLARSLETRRN